ncbi:MAG: hypothetical protein J5814_04080 [Bacteroidaceae bacterium]|nr:hypothetical protein [Bacteroidaceae bacterium]
MKKEKKIFPSRKNFLEKEKSDKGNTYSILGKKSQRIHSASKSAELPILSGQEEIFLYVNF